MDRKKLDDAVKDIRMYTAKHDKLLKAHHFVMIILRLRKLRGSTSRNGW